MIVGVSVGEVRPGYELWRPNREKAESVTTKVVLVILLAATSIIAVIIAISGFSLMSGGTGMAIVTLFYGLLYAFFAFLVACLGGLVVNRAARSDVTYAFLTFYLAVLFGRALWLGQPMAIPLHQVESGAFLIFTFFMISDPRTTPDSRAGRVLFALLVALGAGYVHFVLYRPNGLLLSLFFLSPAVPLIDRLLPGSRYVWRRMNPPVSAPALREERRFA